MITDGRGSVGKLDYNGALVDVVAVPDASFGMVYREGFLVRGGVGLQVCECIDGAGW